MKNTNKYWQRLSDLEKTGCSLDKIAALLYKGKWQVEMDKIISMDEPAATCFASIAARDEFEIKINALITKYQFNI